MFCKINASFPWNFLRRLGKPPPPGQILRSLLFPRTRFLASVKGRDQVSHPLRRDSGSESAIAIATRLFHGFAAYRDIVGIKGVEDLKIRFEGFADLSPEDRRV
jgi:hypothetical protein